MRNEKFVRAQLKRIRESRNHLQNCIDSLSLTDLNHPDYMAECAKYASHIAYLSGFILALETVLKPEQPSEAKNKKSLVEEPLIGQKIGLSEQEDASQ